MPFILRRPINGISINGCEYAVNDDNELLSFPNKIAAITYVNIAAGTHYVSTEEVEEQEGIDIHEVSKEELLDFNKDDKDSNEC